MSYFLMLLFVFITAFCTAGRWLTSSNVDYKPIGKLICLIVALLYAALATFTFHNLW